MIQSKLILNSTFVNSTSQSEVSSLIDNSVIGTFENATLEQVDQAFEYAKSVFTTWSNLSQKERSKFFKKIAAELSKNREEIAKMLSHEIAKPYKSSLEEVDRSVEYIELVVSEMNSVQGELLGGDSSANYKKYQKIGMVEYLPVGVVVCISPFNYPINLSISKIIPGLISGNVVIFKPSSNGLLSAFLMSQIFNSILPIGVFQFLSGKSKEIGMPIVKHKDCNFVNFTGSTQTGREIARQLNFEPLGYLKGLILEMGGKDSAILTSECDINKAVTETMKGAFSFNGQRCTAIKRVFVHSSISETYLSKMKSEIQKLKIGIPFDENVNITTLISEEAADFVEELVNDAIASGLKTEFPHKRTDNAISPNLIVVDSNVKIEHYKDIRILNEEQFGPILPIIVYNDIEKIIEYINSSDYGLENCVFTNNINEAFDISRKLNSGTVQINSKSDRGPDNFPFSGFKNSGFGVQGIRDSIISMMKKKLTVLNT